MQRGHDCWLGKVVVPQAAHILPIRRGLSGQENSPSATGTVCVFDSAVTLPHPGAFRPPLDQHRSVVKPLEPGLEFLPGPQCWPAGQEADEAGRRLVGKLHQRDGVGGQVGRVNLMLHHGPGIHPGPRRDGPVAGVPAAAVIAEGPRQVQHGTAVGAEPQRNLAAGRGLEKSAGIRVGCGGRQPGRPGGGGHRSAVKISALLAGGGADVTRLTSAPGTCAVEVPRIWRTPSTTWFMP